MGEGEDLVNSILTTKLSIPGSPHILIDRPRLTDLLAEGLKRHLTLLSAPAGFGKTTLLTAWLLSRPEITPSTAWVSLDDRDNDPVRFWSYVLTALDNRQPGLYAPLLSVLQGQQAPPLDPF